MSDSSSPYRLQNGLQMRETRLVDVDSSVEDLQAQVFGSMVPEHLERIKNQLLSIVYKLVPDTNEKEKALFFFVTRIVDRSMQILMLMEAMDDIPVIGIERLYQVLEDGKRLVESAHRWKSYPCSVDGLEKVLSIKSRDLEQQIMSIMDDIETALELCNGQTMTTEEPSKQVCNNTSSHFFSHSKNIIVKNSHIYNVTEGSLNFPNGNDRQNAGHPDFLAVQQSELELDRDLYRGQTYRLHGGHTRGKAVVVKVFQGPSAKQLCSKMLEFCRSIIHSNILRIIGVADCKSRSSFLVFDGDFHGTVESRLAMALRQGVKEGCNVGFNTVIACSLGLSYLQDSGLSFQNMGPEHFVLMLSKQDRIVLGFNPDLSRDKSSKNNIHRSGITQSTKAMEIFNDLVQNTFATSFKGHYADKRPYSEDDDAEQTPLEIDDGYDNPIDEVEQRNIHAMPEENVPQYGSPRYFLPNVQGHRRELVWKSQIANSVPLEQIGRHYQTFLEQFHTEQILAHRRGHSTLQIAHRCRGYKRTEIILMPDIGRSGIVSHTSPVPNEICSVCGETVGFREIFECICGLPESDTSNSQPTVKCIVCSRWQHQTCVKLTPGMPLKRFICQRCPGNSIAIDSFGTTPSPESSTLIPLPPPRAPPSLGTLPPPKDLPTPTPIPTPTPMNPPLPVSKPSSPALITVTHRTGNLGDLVFDLMCKVQSDVEREIGRDVAHELVRKVGVQVGQELTRGLEREAERLLTPLGEPGKLLQEMLKMSLLKYGPR